LVAPDSITGPVDVAALLTVRIVNAYLRRLRAEDNVLTRDPDLADELARQVGSILGEVLAEIDSAAVIAPPADQPSSAEVGADRARRGIHPVESLRAATVLFEVALSVLTAEYGWTEAARLTKVATILHRAVMDRVAAASLTYVDQLIQRLHASRGEERRRIARDLHDRLGHTLALTLQNLDLHRHYVISDPPAAAVKFDAALSSLREATQMVQHIAADMRRSVGRDGIERTLQRYLRANVPSSVRTSLEVTGEAGALPANVTEEIYLIVCEAIRNAVRHAAPTRVGIALTVTDALVEATVRDDGRGFDRSGRRHRDGGGLPSMAERADLLGGTLELTSRPDSGTAVTVCVPLTRTGR
jgi:signal transduction histidine kinase